MNFDFIFEKLINGEDLNFSEASALMQMTMSGELAEAQMAAWLTALRIKTEAADEVAAFSKVMREHAVRFHGGNPRELIDTCGTGGDKSNLINVSTMTALTLAAMGHKVVKHGNRSVSSSCGSADILEQAGFQLQGNHDYLKEKLAQTNFVFLFAPQFHPAMKHVGPVRQKLKIRTVFNILGPLANPAFSARHLLGAFSDEVAKLMAHALLRLETSTALVVHSDDGLDEMSLLAKTRYYFVHQKQIIEGVFDPSILDFSLKNIQEIQIRNKEEGLAMTRSVLMGQHQAGIEMVALNVAAALYVIESDNGQNLLNLEDYILANFARIVDFIKTGKVFQVLENLA